MPTYEFICSCGNSKEKISPVTLERVELPYCTCGRRMKRKFSPPGIIFSGSGFYSTDKNK